MSATPHFIVIGAGQAGASLVAKLRSEGFDGDITLIGAEPHLPYQRPPLSKAYLLGEMSRERLFLRPDSFYEDQGVTLRLGNEVTEIDVAAQTVQVGGDVLHYDELAFTTGSAPHRLPAAIGGELSGVYCVRDLADIDAMAPHVVQGRKVLIVGGGYIGLEAAAVCAKKQMQVTVVEMAPRILQRVAAPETSDYFRALHSEHGVEIIEGVGLANLIGEACVTGATLTDGRVLKADLVIVGVGIAPVTALAETIGARIENGIATDEQGCTSIPHHWAAGDCASFPYKGGRLRLESVPNAIEQAEVVACNMLGAGIPYQAKPWFWSDQYDVKLQIAGLNIGYDRVVVRSSQGGLSHWYYQGETLLAVDAMNDPKAYMVGKRLIEAGRSPDPELVADTSLEIRALMA